MATAKNLKNIKPGHHWVAYCPSCQRDKPNDNPPITVSARGKAQQVICPRCKTQFTCK